MSSVFTVLHLQYNPTMFCQWVKIISFKYYFSSKRFQSVHSQLFREEKVLPNVRLHCFLEEKEGDIERTRVLFEMQSITLWLVTPSLAQKHVNTSIHVSRQQIFQLFVHCELHTCQHVPPVTATV